MRGAVNNGQVGSFEPRGGVRFNRTALGSQRAGNSEASDYDLATAHANCWDS